jgi:hypothetical protein
MTVPQEELGRLARESGRLLGELGVRPDDEKWIRTHAETIASLGTDRPAGGRIYGVLARWARRAVRAAR